MISVYLLLDYPFGKNAFSIGELFLLLLHNFILLAS